MPMFWGATTDGKRVFEVIKGLKRHSHKSGSTGVQVQWFWSEPSTILFYQTPHQRSFYSPRDYFNRCSPVMSQMVNLSVEWVLCQLIRIALDVRMYGPICTFVFIHPTMYMPCTVTLWSRFYYQVNERIIPTKTSSRTCWSINLNQHSVVIIILNDEGRWETFGQC